MSCEKCKILERQMLNQGMQIHQLSGELGIAYSHIDRALNLLERQIEIQSGFAETNKALLEKLNQKSKKEKE